eukprot:2278528-Amphidinium_carterae.1
MLRVCVQASATEPAGIDLNLMVGVLQGWAATRGFTLDKPFWAPQMVHDFTIGLLASFVSSVANHLHVANTFQFRKPTLLSKSYGNWLSRGSFGFTELHVWSLASLA